MSNYFQNTMTYFLPLSEAASQLVELVHRLREDDTILLLENNVPVANITPHQEIRAEIAEIKAYRTLRGTLLLYDDPTDPISPKDWEALQ